MRYEQVGCSYDSAQDSSGACLSAGAEEEAALLISNEQASIRALAAPAKAEALQGTPLSQHNMNVPPSLHQQVTAMQEAHPACRRRPELTEFLQQDVVAVQHQPCSLPVRLLTGRVRQPHSGSIRLLSAVCSSWVSLSC